MPDAPTASSPNNGSPTAGTQHTVTVSAVYGAGGSVIAPALARRLGLPFFDRLIHDATESSDTVRDAITERLSREERDQAPPGRLVASLANLTSVLGLPAPGAEEVDTRGRLRRQVATSVSQIAASTGGVILGRAAAVVLDDTPGTFHVRLIGSSHRCLAQGASIEGVSTDEARKRQADTDRAWSRFVTRLFDRDPADSTLYHLVLDTTVMSLDDAVALIATAAEMSWKAR
jgi:cytidylate kinase